METVAELMPRFFQELAADGQIDRALAVARGPGLVRNRPDAWMPALFLRLRGGRLWDESGAGSGATEVAADDAGRRRWLGAALVATLGTLAVGGYWWAMGPTPVRTRPLTGTILGADGEPLEDVKVRLPALRLETPTDDLGRFDLQVSANAGEILTLEAKHPDYCTLERYPAAGTLDLKYRLTPRKSQHGKDPRRNNTAR